MITIEPLNIFYSKRLAEIISTDEKLHMDLSASKPLESTSAEEFYRVCKAWEDKNSAVCYCILNNGVPVGTISVSHRDFENKTAKCGYWIESSCWGKGYTTKAFELAIEEARQSGIELLTASILKDNLASIALWKRQGASLQRKGGRVFPTLFLGSPVRQHYDSLIDEINDPARDDSVLKEYMNKWDGQEFIDELQLADDKTVLEICVGTGRIALKVCGNCKSFTGIDFSPKTIERAKINLQAFGNLNLICADFMNYEFESQFDVVYSTLTFMHIRDKQAAISKIASLLTANGRFVLSIDKNRDDILDYGTRKIVLFPDNPVDTAHYIREAGLRIERQFETEFAVVIVAVK